jgi:hypothetical protein
MIRDKMRLPVDIRIIVTAAGFPALALILGFILILSGNATNNENMIIAGRTFIVVAFAAFCVSLMVVIVKIICGRPSLLRAPRAGGDKTHHLRGLKGLSRVWRKFTPYAYNSLPY